MNQQELKAILWQENAIEFEQRTQGYNVNDQNLPFAEIAVPKMPSDHFFREGNIFINKHHRYSAMPAHTHEFVEFNYMYSGSCVQYINDQPIYLQEGEILLIDKDIIQRIDPLAEDDILINILLKDDSITTEIVVNMVKANSLVNEFLLTASNELSSHNNFIHFKSGSNEEVKETLFKMITEYFEKKNYYMRSLNLLLSLLFIQLTRELEAENLENYQAETNILDVLRYIDSHYRNLNLQELAEVFGYNKNYLSNKLKKETGRSFQELINTLRYQAAIEMIEETDQSFEEIAYQLGFETLPSLYKLFAKYTDKTPKEFRKH
ncbi:AraC family transcriptional regulator [Enterococcus sp. LJL120]|uniref:AraC family transcriptional regulator n=1 Tax=Enterococcus sp. HY326 TaxID=2971265 RepID=UPI0022407E85|nr:AraC family transcriptional regulator [Enterococcus sp. HY326]